jgi:menaquinone-dependent protoporphyrinogen oxidase
MSRTLVAYASKMGGTEGIARAVADGLRGAGLEVDLARAEDVRDLEPYGSVILGSAIYAGRWRRPARRLLRLLVADKRIDHPVRVWLFQSGPTGPDKAGTSVPAPAKVAAQAIALGADQPTTFGGRIEPATAKGFLATSMAKGDLAGDYRDFGQIAAWARGIAADLTADAATST